MSDTQQTTPADTSPSGGTTPSAGTSGREALKAAVLRLAGPAVRAQGLEIWGVELLGERTPVVRLYVEVPRDDHGTGTPDCAPENASDGVAEGAPDHTGDVAATADGENEVPLSRLSATVDQCEAISRQLSLAMDVEDVVDRAYTLEVSTPGFNRIFFSAAQMAPYVGDFVEARLPEPWSPAEGLPARRVWKGVLRAVDGDVFVLAPARADAAGEVVFEDLPEAALPFARTRRVARVHLFRAPVKPGAGTKPGKGGAKSGKGGAKSGRKAR